MNFSAVAGIRANSLDLISSIEHGGEIPKDINETLNNYRLQLSQFKKESSKKEEPKLKEREQRERKVSKIPEIAHMICKRKGSPQLKNCKSTYSKWLLKRPQTLQTLVNSSMKSK
tara:strand:- start:476 stop:820 length:345 start_codon:yes stop_codon:yes gene_type:complete